MSSLFLMETPESQLTAGQPTSKKCRSLSKNDILPPKTKKQPQKDGSMGTIRTTSNTVPMAWVTHKLENSYPTEVSPPYWKFWAPCQLPQPGDLATRGEAPRERGAESQWCLILVIPQDWGQQKLRSRRLYARSCVHRDPGKQAMAS